MGKLKKLDIAKRVEILENLLAMPGTVHPIGCNCAIKSRAVKHHLPDCPYRMLKELLPELKVAAKQQLESRSHGINDVLDAAPPPPERP